MRTRFLIILLSAVFSPILFIPNIAEAQQGWFWGRGNIFWGSHPQPGFQFGHPPFHHHNHWYHRPVYPYYQNYPNYYPNPYSYGSAYSMYGSGYPMYGSGYSMNNYQDDNPLNYLATLYQQLNYLGNSQSSANADVVSIGIKDGKFLPALVEIPPGTTVTWTNKGTHAHNVKPLIGTWKSSNLDPGQTYSYTFGMPGTYDYQCTIHPDMRGTIVVK